MKHIYLIFCVLCTGILVQAQSENILLDRSFWKKHPSIAEIQSKIDEGHDPTAKTRHAFDAISYAMLEKNPLETTQFLLTQGNDINKITHDGRNYMFWAAYKSDLPMMEYLLEKGSRMDIIDSHGNSVLMFAASTGQTDPAVYEFCEKNGMSLLEEKDREGRNALLAVAARLKDDYSILDYLVSRGLKSNAVDDHGHGLYYYASRSGNLDLMDKVEAIGAKKDAEAYVYATYNKDIPLSFYKGLEAVGLDPATKSKSGKTALHNLAYYNKDRETFNYFIEKGVDVQSADENGNTAFINAARRNELSVLQLLLDHKAQVNATNNDGQTALMRAAMGNNAEVFALLLKNGADINAADKEGQNASYYLVQAFRPDQMEDFSAKMDLLKANGFDPKLPMENGNTLLHVAIEKHNVDLLKYLLETGLDINAKNKEGYTALHQAAMQAKTDEILKYLITAGANKEMTTEFEESAFDLAKENELLKQNGVNVDFLK